MGKRSRQTKSQRERRSAAVATETAPGETRAAAPTHHWRLDFYICLALLAATLAVYSRAVHFDFTNFDDPEYVTENSHVRYGFTGPGVTWAFTHYYAANWSPLTWLSHMADCEIFGLRSGWHHLTNVLLHAAAALLLFAALKRLTGARWPSAFAAFVFALHPLHVESVAWIAERKDVLCAVFWFLTLWCYAGYVQRPGRVRYLLVLVSFCLGLLAKPMIVTLPFVLLLLDAWPLGRVSRRAVWEKVPFFLVAAGAALVTFLAQEHGRAVRSLAAVPVGLRIENALVTYAAYIVRMFWPADLAVFYPYPAVLPVWRVAAAASALVAITVFALRRARSHPYLAVGWFWYLGTLVPVIGLVQVGAQASADRYTYVPMVGLTIMLGWGAADLVKRHSGLTRPIVALAAAAGIACVLLTRSQLSYWKDSESLFRHAIDVTSDNYIAHNNLANYYLVHKRNQEAAVQIDAALRIKPAYPDAHVNLAYLLKQAGRYDESEREYQAALSLQPANPEAHSGYGALLVAEGRAADALREFSTVISLRPDYADGHYDLGRVLAAMGRADEAAAQFYEAIRLRPDHADARRSLGFLLLSRGRFEEALVQFRAEARLKPDDASIHYTVGQLLVSAGRFDEAIAEFSEALRIKPDFAGARRSLEMAQAQRSKRQRP